MDKRNFVIIGKIEDVFGYDGKLKVRLLAPHKLWESLNRVFLKKKGGDYVPFDVEKVEVRGKKAYIKLKGINSEEEALKTVGAHIYFPEGDLPKLKSGEYYYYQLLGCEVLDKQGNKLGTVQYIHNSGPYPLLVLENDRLIPFTKNFVLEVDPEGKKIVVDEEKLP